MSQRSSRRRRTHPDPQRTGTNRVPAPLPFKATQNSGRAHHEKSRASTRKIRGRPLTALLESSTTNSTTNLLVHDPARLQPSKMSNPTQQPNPPCPKATASRLQKEASARNRLRTPQLFQCTECLFRFTSEPGKNRTYPLKLILVDHL